MSLEKMKILEMLENGKISAQEAEQLLDALEPARESAAGSAAAPSGPSAQADRAGQRDLTGKKLRIYVVGDVEEQKNMNVNVTVPLALARLVDNVIENCIPNEALDEMKKHGVDLKAIRLGDMIGSLETLGEDIVNADIKTEDSDLKVRVYVE